MTTRKILKCFECQLLGYCRNRQIKLVPTARLEDAEYIRDLKSFTCSLGVSDADWQEHINDLYRDMSGWIIGHNGTEVFLNMEEFERPSIREWFRDFAQPCPPHVMPRVRCEAKERVRILATVLSAHFPVQSVLWGIRPANDNHAPRRF